MVLHVEILIVGYGWNSYVLVLHWGASCCHLIHFVHVLLFLVIRQCIILLSRNSSIVLTWIHWISDLPIFTQTDLWINIMGLMDLLGSIISDSFRLYFINLLIVLLSHVKIVWINFISDCLKKILVYEVLSIDSQVAAIASGFYHDDSMKDIISWWILQMLSFTSNLRYISMWLR